MYLRSLDHQGIQVKQADKKHFSAKHLVDAIKTKHEQFRRNRKLTGTVEQWQETWKFDDMEILVDTLRLMIIYATGASQHNNLERRRICDFFEKFIPMFFDIPTETVSDRIQDVERATPDDDSEEATPVELPNGRGKRNGNGKKNTDLRRGVLDKGRNGARGRGQKEDSATGSKESTPDNDSVAEDDPDDPTDDPPISEDNWASLNKAAPVDTHDASTEDLDFTADQPFIREGYRLWCNQTLFLFISIVHTIYQRLKEIKDSESEAREETIRQTREKPAKAMGLMKHTDDYYQDLAVDSGETYYQRTISLIEDFINGDVDETQYQAAIRQYYLKRGWRIYTIQDFLKQLSRLGTICTSNDSKEKTASLLNLYYNNRTSDETTYNAEISMRKQAQKYIKDGDLFLVEWVSAYEFSVSPDCPY
jgi:paired amphipathic helix protein Sin3a